MDRCIALAPAQNPCARQSYYCSTATPVLLATVKRQRLETQVAAVGPAEVEINVRRVRGQVGGTRIRVERIGVITDLHTA